MESTALQQAFDTCQNNKAAWLQRKNELAAAEQEYLRLLSGEGRNVSRLDELRNIIEVRLPVVIFVRMKPFSTSASATG